MLGLWDCLLILVKNFFLGGLIFLVLSPKLEPSHCLRKRYVAHFIGLEMSLWLLVASGSGLKRVLILVDKDFSMSSDFQ